MTKKKSYIVSIESLDRECIIQLIRTDIICANIELVWIISWLDLIENDRVLNSFILDWTTIILDDYLQFARKKEAREKSCPSRWQPKKVGTISIILQD